MKTFNYTIKDELGLHARPCSLLIKKATEFSSEILIETNGKTADCKKMFALMGMGIKCGDNITLTVTGDDEDSAITELEKLFTENL